MSPDYGLSFADHIHHVEINGERAGEDAILAIADIYQCKVLVFTSKSLPLIYKPLNSFVKFVLLCVAFFLPGHYMVVIPLCCSNKAELQPYSVLAERHYMVFCQDIYCSGRKSRRQH